MQHAETGQTTREIIERFNDAFNLHDVDAVMALMTDDVVFENTGPAPEGSRHAGYSEVRRFWQRFFASSPTATFETEDIFCCDDRCAVTWRYTWAAEGERGSDDPGYVRGIDVFRVRNGKVAEKHSYVKG